MPETNIGNTDTSSLATAQDDYSVETETTDGAFDSKETEWINTEWTQQFGYYKQIAQHNSECISHSK